MARNFGLIASAGCALLLAIGSAAVVSAGLTHYVDSTDAPSLRPGMRGSVAAFADASQAALGVLSRAFVTESPLVIAGGDNERTAGTPLAHFAAPHDRGYLLWSGYDQAIGASRVKLIRLSDGKPLLTWTPDWSKIGAATSSNRFGAAPTPGTGRAIHPLLLPDGDVIFNTGMSLVRMSPCSAQPRWLINWPFHHSIEWAADRQAIWVPSMSREGFYGNAAMRSSLMDNALGLVGLDGRVRELRSFSRIIRDNGLETLMLGLTGQRSNPDPMHINQIAVATADGIAWRRGDLLISSRHMSTLFLYRPATNKILWYKTGPWMNQHSAQFLNDHQIIVLDNHVLGNFNDADYAFVNSKEFNRIAIFDFNSMKVSEPYKEALSKINLKSITEGRINQIDENNLMVSDENSGKIYSIYNNGVNWKFENIVGKNKIGILGWSRYYKEDDIEIKNIIQNNFKVCG